MISEYCLLCNELLWVTKYDPDCNRIWMYCNNGLNLSKELYEEELYKVESHYKLGYFIHRYREYSFELDILDIKLPVNNLYLEVFSSNSFKNDLDIDIYEFPSKITKANYFQNRKYLSTLDKEIFFNNFDLLLNEKSLRKILAFL